ncbi:MAG TPA: hypothetical protein VKR53_03365 [Puia sp.]|nr:hypothetical protein [Puia sp.]
MLRSVSWQGFFIVTGMLTGIYYTIIALIYYRTEIGIFLRSPKKWKNIFQKTSSPKEKNNEDFFASASTLKKEVDQLISNAYYRKTNKTDLHLGLREHLENYAGLPEHFRIAINNHIQSTGEKTGLFPFTKEELSMLWRAGE